MGGHFWESGGFTSGVKHAIDASWCDWLTFRAGYHPAMRLGDGEQLFHYPGGTGRGQAFPPFVSPGVYRACSMSNHSHRALRASPPRNPKPIMRVSIMAMDGSFMESVK